MAEEKQVMKLLERGYFVLPMIDKGIELELIETIDVEITKEEIGEFMDKPEILFDPFKENKAGWAEFTATYFMLPNIILKAAEGMKEKYDYIVPIMATLGLKNYTVRISFDCFNKVS